MYFPDKVSTGFIMTKISEKLAVKNNVSVYTIYPTGQNKIEDIEIVNNVKVYRYFKNNLNKNKTFQRIIKFVFSSLILFIKSLIKVKKNDIALVVTNPAFFLIFMAVLRRIKKIKLIVLVHDVFPENVKTTGFFSEKSILYKLLYKIFTYSYKSADELIVLGRDMKFLFEKRLKNKKNITVIQNWSETESIIPANKNVNFTKKHSLENKFIILFVGNIGRVQAINVIIKIASLLKNKQGIHFLFVGDGASSSLLTNYIKQGNKNLTWTGNLPRSEQNIFLNACDLSIVSLSKGMKGLGVPSKTYNIIAAGKPILGILEEGSEISILIKEKKIGWTDNSYDADVLAKKIIYIKTLKKKLELYGNNARRLSETEYTQDIILNKYDEIFQQLINE